MFDEKTAKYLYSTQEISRAWAKSERRVRELCGKPGVYCERHQDQERGGQGTLYFDPKGIIERWGEPIHPLTPPEDLPMLPAIVEGQKLKVESPLEHPLEVEYPLPTTPPEPIGLDIARPNTDKTIMPDLRQVHPDDLAWANRLTGYVKELQVIHPTHRSGKLTTWATTEQCSLSTLYRWIATVEKEGPAALLKKRADIGRSQLPQETEAAIVSLWLNHPKVGAGYIHRRIRLRAPEMLTYQHGDYRRRLSERGIRDVRSRMEQDPAFRAALFDEDQRREFLRTWAGYVFAEYPNHLWEADFTRCDTYVVDLAEYAKTRKVRPIRLRIHALIDVASETIPSFVFSRFESQQPTNRMFQLALMPKPIQGGWQQRWPIYGKPERVFNDNGGIYTSDTTIRAMETLRIEQTRSRAWVSHTRGAIERFFGVVHQDFEKGLPGYAGEDVTQKASWEINRLVEKTEAWLLRGAPQSSDPYPDRLLTDGEYMQQALLWLTTIYHKNPLPSGKSREQIYLETVPAHTLVQYDFTDLLKIFASAETRTVAGNGTIRYKNLTLALEDGSLMVHQGQNVVVLEIEHPLTGDPLFNLQLPRGDGTLIELGWATELDGPALSAQARAHRAATKAQAKAILSDAKAILEQYADPTWRQDKIMAKAAQVEPKHLQLPAPGPKATLEQAQPQPVQNALETLVNNPSPLVQALLGAYKPITPSEPESEGLGERFE